MSDIEQRAMVVRSRMVENGLTTNASEVDGLIAAAREEGRREGGAHWERQYHRLNRDADDERRLTDAAHAAQFVAMREATVLAVLVWFMRRIRPAIEVVLPEALVKLPTPELAVTQFRAYEERNGIAPLPDAEAALEKVREEAVRWCVDNPRLMGWTTLGMRVPPSGEQAAPTVMESHPSETRDEYVARALNALGAKPKEGA